MKRHDTWYIKCVDINGNFDHFERWIWDESGFRKEICGDVEKMKGLKDDINRMEKDYNESI